MSVLPGAWSFLFGSLEGDDLEDGAEEESYEEESIILSGEHLGTDGGGAQGQSQGQGQSGYEEIDEGTQCGWLRPAADI